MRRRARIVAAAWLLVLVEVGLRTLPLRVVARLVGVGVLEPGVGRGEPVGAVELPWWAGARVAAASRVVARWPFEGRCLREGLVAGAMLRRFDPVLRIGVRRASSGRLAAHAWIEVDGATFDLDAPSFAPLELVRS